MTKKNSINYFTAILLLSIIARCFAALYFADVDLVNEWAILVHNLEFSGILGYNVITTELNVIPKFVEAGETVLPSVFMPPLYAYFIYFIKILFIDTVNYIKAIIFIQILLSLITIFVFYKILKNFYDTKITFISTIIFSLLPLNVYSSVQISSISLQLFLLVFYFLFILKYFKTYKFKYLILFSIFSGLLILIRGEFIIFYVFTLGYFFIFLKKDFKSILVSLIISIIVISPYLKRNYEHFDKYFLLTKSFGYNLLKGNNPETKVEGYVNLKSHQFTNELTTKPNNSYEIDLDNFYKEEAFRYMTANPMKYFKLYVLKIFSFIFIDLNSTYPNYYNASHLFPKIILSVLSLIGAVVFLFKKSFFQYLSLYYFSNILLFSLFFILPRYSLILLPIQMLLSIEALKFLRSKLIN